MFELLSVIVWFFTRWMANQSSTHWNTHSTIIFSASTKGMRPWSLPSALFSLPIGAIWCKRICDIWCNVTSMDEWHILLHHPWQFGKRAISYRNRNTYLFIWAKRTLCWSCWHEMEGMLIFSFVYEWICIRKQGGSSCTCFECTGRNEVLKSVKGLFRSVL